MLNCLLSVALPAICFLSRSAMSCPVCVRKKAWLFLRNWLKGLQRNPAGIFGKRYLCVSPAEYNSKSLLKNNANYTDTWSFEMWLEYVTICSDFNFFIYFYYVGILLLLIKTFLRWTGKFIWEKLQMLLLVNRHHKGSWIHLPAAINYVFDVVLNLKKMAYLKMWHLHFHM